ncbi:kinase/pyrophosphorylase [Gammaproteobacteria bacterium]|nr:kinase/pyrophosphorylase [Gammaproteobacteria bacterium]
MPVRPVFVVSDRTGITGEMICNSLLTQFPGVEFEVLTRPFTDTEEKLRKRVAEIDSAAQASGQVPLVFTTLVHEADNAILKESRGELFDFFGMFLGPLEKVLDTPSSHSVGRTHGMVDARKYAERISAVNYAVHCDDGLNTGDYARAEVILVGVSRSGKTPTSLYLSLHYGIFAGNFPLTPDDLEELELPDALMRKKDRLFGLLIDPARLHQIRQERSPNSHYASLAQCRLEIRLATQIFERERIPYIDSTSLSIEELAATVIHKMGLTRR